MQRLYKLVKHLDRASRWIGRVPSFAFATLYLTLIPTFASIYVSFDAEFYQNSLRLEQALWSDIQQAENDLARDIREQFVSEFGTGMSLYNNNYISLQSPWFMVHRLQIRLPEAADFKVTVPMFRFGGNAYVTSETITVTFFLDPTDARLIPTDDRAYVLADPVLRTYRPVDCSPDNICEALFRASPHLPSRALFLRVSSETQTSLHRCVDALGSLQPDTSSEFWRMFYFSAVTITTVGYGDIVPLTTRTRLLVAGEAILGVVIIGLFLNSVASAVRAAPPNSLQEPT